MKSPPIKRPHKQNDKRPQHDKKKYNMKTIRMIIYPNDVALITGKTDRQARNILNQVRRDLNKAPNQYITIEEFCTSRGLPYHEVLKRLF